MKTIETDLREVRNHAKDASKVGGGINAIGKNAEDK
jgi:hypothetical protein